MTVRREQYFTYLLLGVFSLIALVPIVGIIFTALQEQGSLSSFGQPDGLHFGNFADAWREGNFADYLKSSAIVVVAVVAFSTVFSIMAGYAFGMMRFRGSSLLFYLLLLGLMVPLEAFIVPLYYDLRELSLTDTYWALIWPQVGVSTAFGTFWMRAFFQSVPRSLVEAAPSFSDARPSITRLSATSNSPCTTPPSLSFILNRTAKPKALTNQSIAAATSL
jgi:raffinose/stachyose/melibiose transport system permease protein